MRSKDHLVPQELREMPDKWKEKQQKTCISKDLIASLSLPLSSSVSHRPKEKKKKKISVSWSYIICPCNSLEGDSYHGKKQESLMRGLFMFLCNNQY